MNEQTTITPPLDGRDPAHLRGDAIDGARYYSKEFAQKEWDGMWTRIWHIAGRTAEMPEPGAISRGITSGRSRCIGQNATVVSLSRAS